MARKSTSKRSIKNEGTYIEGDVHASTFINRDQVNYNTQINISTPAEFSAELHRVQIEVQALKPGIAAEDVALLDSTIQSIQKAITEVEQPQPVGERVRSFLEKAEKTILLVDGSIKAAVGLGTTLGGLALIALKLFGG